MPRCIIICPLWQGELLCQASPRPGDLLLCADAGWAAAVRYGLTPDAAIGDFDTMPVSEVHCNAVERLPVHKDDTDLGVCIRRGQEAGYHDFLLLGCIGGRLDHTLAMLQLISAAARRGDRITAADSMNRITVLAPGSYTLEEKPGTLLSLLSLSDVTEGIELTGTEWPLHDAALTNTYPLGISNVILGGKAQLSFRKGLLAVCYAVNRTVNGT